MSTIWTVLLAIVIFGLFVFVHELGHFVAAKSFGIQVNDFALGFGPALLKFKKGDTTYALRAVPFGGYVAMEGDEEESANPRSFLRQAVWKRAVVMAAGGFMNLVLGLIVVLIVLNMQPNLGTVKISSFREQAVSGSVLQVGDEIVRINGARMRIDNDISFALVRDEDGIANIQVRRAGELVDLQVPFQMQDFGDGQRGIYIDFTVFPQEKTFASILYNGFFYTVSIAKMVWVSLLDLVTGRVAVSQLSGPIGVTAVISEATTMGLRPLLMLIAFITVNLGVFNLLPLPALDGGKLLFLAIEAVRRKPVPEKYENYVHTAGFVLLFGLIIFVTFQDIVRLFTR